MLARSAARIRGSTAEAPGGLGASLPPATRPFRSMGTSAAKGIKPRIHRPRPALGLHLPEPPAAPLDPGMGMLRDAAHTGQILMRTGSSAHVQTESEQRRRGEEGDRTTLMRERAALSAGSGAVCQWDGNSPKPFDRANVPRDRYAALAGSRWPTSYPTYVATPGRVLPTQTSYTQKTLKFQPPKRPGVTREARPNISLSAYSVLAQPPQFSGGASTAGNRLATRSSKMRPPLSSTHPLPLPR
ncbi:hypothetical protein OIDMADRAFT_49746 [Oidiodendron maius Zn]|uniref:Uncharacterized protein n=1 Tax=Oidiodendron maius (strain Zn) TaxID=913774 RepID=A0A0C3D4P1_OIDMZ|nr:hypothetical protein OIDMADRAFT_49746 [Oidiodendron maius Zn]